MMSPTSGPQLLMRMSSLLQEMEATVPASKSLPANQPSRDRTTPEAFRLLDWTNLDLAPSSMDVTRMVGIGGREGGARFAILVNTPRMLRAANVFAEQAGLHGAQVRVFVDAKEALAWLYKDVPSAMLDHQWPESQPAAALHPLRTPTHR